MPDIQVLYYWKITDHPPITKKDPIFTFEDNLDTHKCNSNKHFSNQPSAAPSYLGIN